MPKPGILIVDDNVVLHYALKVYLTPHFDSIDTVKNPNLVLSLIERTPYDVILLDMNFKAGIQNGNEGLYWLKRILEISPNACVVMITAYGDIELAVKAMKEGATDFIQKSWDDQKILATLLSAYKQHCARLEIKELKEKQKHLNRQLSQPFEQVVGQSSRMQKVLDAIARIAGTNANVLIEGENGTGKEVIAREIHRLSERKDQVFINVDMGALSESLFESELFGHKKGAFTDAREDRIGRFELANKGSLFLDEIANTPLSLQPKLLAALQNREIVPLGSSISRSVDIRLISATNQSVKSLVEKGLFREDLFYRINTITIEVPPLRERKEDIPALVNHFLKKYGNLYKKPDLSVKPSVLKKLSGYDWPGNIRELQHTIERMVIFSETSILNDDSFNLKAENQSDQQTGNLQSISYNERKLIARVLEECNGNIKLAARKLEINRSTLYDKIKKYGI